MRGTRKLLATLLAAAALVAGCGTAAVHEPSPAPTTTTIVVPYPPGYWCGTPTGGAC